ncbi:isochorismate synthase [Corchorus olitorius]|uniref:Isochorismate synthase n=1 Tax=Corchorus olitorius TaxID=93759 RepID=A0A1R3L3N1_9ROSI|nr:isochorismate synthase [Corchorus olitorius]
MVREHPTRKREEADQLARSTKRIKARGDGTKTVVSSSLEVTMEESPFQNSPSRM